MLPMLIGAGVMGGLGYLQGERQQADDKAWNLANAEVARWSPWSKQSAQFRNTTDPMSTALQGGMSGLGIGQSLMNAGVLNPTSAPAPQAAAVENAAPMSSMSGQSFAPSIGGDQMASTFSNMGKSFNSSPFDKPKNIYDTSPMSQGMFAKNSYSSRY